MTEGARREPREPDLIDPDSLDFGEGATGAADAGAGAPAEPEVLDPDSLDFGLGVAFAKPGARKGEGVASALDRMTGGAPRVLLPDDSDGPAPMLRVLPGGGDRLGADGRYESLGEIARGGLGIVLKGRDRDLGRDVAIKVLRPEFAQNDAVLARFIEEAQIGGQLQHPGLVPVYSLGMGKEGRPFFAMKLVKGRTLASLLVDRKSPREGLRRHLATFESVCRTMAYAHSRRVVHRDLKPSNIMLGAFGEVQVVDWGLAKVLGREDVPGVRPAEAAAEVSLIATVRSGSAGSGSLAGSVLGTPGYLSPEQALGRIEDVDERTDVFALGSILCEILTGEPPFTGDARDQIVLAARGDTAEAQARLAKCGADPAIVAIATKCLASDRDERWRDAGAVADAVTAHLSGAEARARQAELAAAEERAKADEEKTHAARERSAVARERAAQRRTIAVSSGALALVAVAIVAWRIQSSDEDDRRTKAAAAVSAALADANTKRGAANLVGAIDSAQKAVALAKTGEVDAATSDRAAKVLTEIEVEERAAKAAAAQAAKDEAFAAAIARAQEAFETDEEAARWTADRLAAFREYGVDLEKCDVEAGAALLRASPRLADMTAVLDLWVVRSRDRQTEHPVSPEAGALVDRVDRIVRAADPDPWRSQLRDAMKTGEGDKTVIRALANSPEIEKQPDETLDWMAWAFNRVGDNATVLKLGRIQERRHPGQPWLGIGSLASAMIRARGGNPDEMSAAWTARLALHPGTDRWRQLGHALSTSKEPAAAIAAFEEAVRLNPGSYSAYADLMLALISEFGHLDGRLKQVVDRAKALDPQRGEAWFYSGKILLRLGEFAAAEADLRKSVALLPGNASAHAGLAHLLGELRRFDEAVAAYREAVRLDPTSTHFALLVTALKTAGDFDAAVAEGKRAIELFPGDYDVIDSYSRALEAAAGRAAAAGDRATGLALADTAIELRRKALAAAPRKASAHSGLGLALSNRASLSGNVCPEAIDELRESIRLEDRPTFQDAHQAHEWLADELARAGRTAEALAEYARSLRIYPSCPQGNHSYGVLLSASERDQSEAIQVLRRAVALAPERLESRRALIQAMIATQSGPPASRSTAEELQAEVKRLADAQTRFGKPGTPDDENGRARTAATERYIALLFDPQFPETVRRGVKPADRSEANRLLGVCCLRRLYADGVRVAIDGLSSDCKPSVSDDSDVRHSILYDGACSAARAANGDGEDTHALDAAARTKLRHQGFEWLREVCALDVSAVGGADIGKAVTSRDSLAHSLVDGDFASVRDPDALAKLPADERAAWERLWAEVDRAVRSFSERTK